MKQAFTYTDEKSDKFWWIDYEDDNFVVNYGKTGSTGRYEMKEFDSPTLCEKQAKKLIAQKQKKGYDPAPDFDFINHFYFDTEDIGLHPKTSHPYFREHFSDDIYYDCADEEAPFGSDEGADTLAEIMDVVRGGGVNYLYSFPERLIKDTWNMTYFPPESVTKEELESLLTSPSEDSIPTDELVFMSDQVVVATAFGQIKVTGFIDRELKEMGLLSLKRMRLYNEINGYDTHEYTDRMYADLESFNHISEGVIYR